MPRSSVAIVLLLGLCPTLKGYFTFGFLCFANLFHSFVSVNRCAPLVSLSTLHQNHANAHFLAFCGFFDLFSFHRAACWFRMEKKNSVCSKEFSVATEQDCRAAFDCTLFHDATRSESYPDVFYVRSDAHSPKGCIRQDLGHRGGVWLWNVHATGGTPSNLVNPICLKGK